MGQPRFLPARLSAFAAAGALMLAGCSAGSGELLQAADLAPIYAGGTGGAGYTVTSTDESVRTTVSGRIAYTGRRRSRPVQIDPSKPFCVRNNPNGMLSEDFVVGKDGGLGGCVVYIKRGLNKVKWPVPSEPVILDQVNCQYVPHLAVVRIGQPLVVKSSDAEIHNVRAADGPNEGFNRSMTGIGTLAPLVWNKQEVAKKIQCDVHGWMSAYVAALPHPCYAITSGDGSFSITGVPPGKYMLEVWHESLGTFNQDIVVTASTPLMFNHVFEG